MTKLLRIAIWPAAFVLALALTFGTAAALGQEKPAEPPRPAPKVVPLTAEQLQEQAILELQAENLRLRVCSDAQINWRVCEVRWRDRAVVDTTTLPKEQPQTQ